MTQPLLTKTQLDALKTRVYRKYGSLLPPERAIMLEAAGEAESIPAELAYFERLTAHFATCAENGEPLCAAPDFAVFQREDGSVDVHISENPIALSYTSALPLGLSFQKELAHKIASALLENPAAARPVCAAVALFSSPDGTAALLSRARARRADVHNPKKSLAAEERSLLGLINRYGSGAAGFGGGHTALTCKIEAEEQLPSSGFSVSVILDSPFLVSVNLNKEQLRG
jgi:hypothetical protein